MIEFVDVHFSKEKIKKPESLDAILIFTPPYVYTELQPGIAAINAFANHAGIKTKIIDANIGGLEYVLSNSGSWFLSNFINGIRTKKAISFLKEKKSYLPENFEAFKNTKDVIELLSLKASMKSEENFRLRRNTITYIPKYDAQTRQGIIDALEDKKSNLFYEYFDRYLVPQLLELKEETDFKVVGIAITDRKQVIPGFILSSMIKERSQDIKTVIGGNFISRNRDVLIKNDEINKYLFSHVDFMQILEADKAFPRLVKDVSQNRPISSEKTIWYENNKINFNPSKEYLNLDETPTPLFDGLESWTPEPVIAYNFQRGCNYGKCGFCGLMDGYDTFSQRSKDNPSLFQPRHRSYDLIIHDFKNFKSKGYKFINLTDETFFAKDQMIISELLSDNNLHFQWTSYDRIEDGFLDKNLVATIFKGGSFFKQFGVESLSLKSLDSMNKGTDNLNIYQILKNTHDAGIMNHVFLLIGYPEETVEEALSLFPFLEKTKNYVFTVKPAWYKLSRGSPDSFNPEVKGINRLYTEGDLAPNLHFETTKGMSKKTGHAINDILEGWVNRNHILNYVSGTYCYSQRLFAGYKTIIDVAHRIESGEIKRPNPFNPQTPLSNREERALKQVWGDLVGQDFFKISRKYNEGNRNPQLISAYERIREKNITTQYFPAGFKSIDDLVFIAKKISEGIKTELIHKD